MPLCFAGRLRRWVAAVARAATVEFAPAASALGVLPTPHDVIASVSVTALSLYSPLEVGVSGLSFGFPVHVEWIFVGGVR